MIERRDEKKQHHEEALMIEGATALLKNLEWLAKIEGKRDHWATYFLSDREVQIHL